MGRAPWPRCCCRRSGVTSLLPAGLGALPWPPLTTASLPRTQGSRGHGGRSPEPEAHGTRRLYSGPGSSSAPCFDPFRGQLLQEAQNGHRELPPMFIQFVLLESFGQMSLQPRLRALIDPVPQAEPPEAWRRVGPGVGREPLSSQLGPGSQPMCLVFANRGTSLALLTPLCSDCKSGRKRRKLPESDRQKQGFVCKVGN